MAVQLQNCLSFRPHLFCYFTENIFNILQYFFIIKFGQLFQNSSLNCLFGFIYFSFNFLLLLASPITISYFKMYNHLNGLNEWTRNLNLHSFSFYQVSNLFFLRVCECHPDWALGLINFKLSCNSELASLSS